MIAYYQNQVVTNRDGITETVVFSNNINLMGFVASQRVKDNITKNVIRRLSMQSSKDNPAKVYCVSFFDLPDGNYQQEYLFKGKALSPVVFTAVTEKGTEIENSLYIESATDEDSGLNSGLVVHSSPTINGCDSGYIVNSDRDEYIDINCINRISDKLLTVQADATPKLQSQVNARLISPLSLLTRKNKERVARGDIIIENEFKDAVDAITALWYDNHLYWTDSKPEGVKDITDISLFTSSYYKSKVVRDDNTVVSEVKYSLIPLFSKLNPFSSRF